jgi:hypothetical protein
MAERLSSILSSAQSRGEWHLAVCRIAKFLEELEERFGSDQALMELMYEAKPEVRELVEGKDQAEAPVDGRNRGYGKEEEPVSRIGEHPRSSRHQSVVGHGLSCRGAVRLGNPNHETAHSEKN